MLWLALYFPQLPLEVFTRGRQLAGPLAVTAPRAGRETVSRCNAVAQSYGVRAGMALPTALSLCAGLAVQRRDRGLERRALDELAAWAYQFSARICFEPSLLLLEVGASRRLFGGLRQLLQRLQQGLRQLGYEARHALAPTPTAAGLLARNRPACEVLDHVALHDAVVTLPVDCLTRDRKVRELVRHVGLQDIGEVLALPRAELARRVGPQLPALLDRLLGRAADPRREWSPPRRFEQHIDLLGEIGQATALVFPARRLMIALSGFLRGLGGGAQRLHWTLRHRDERPPTVFDQGLLDPTRDADHMLEVFRERIERLVLPAPVIAIGLRVDHWQAFAEHSRPLFAQAMEDGVDARDQVLLERLSNRLGEQRVRGVRCIADHRPERAWQLCRPGETEDHEARPGSAALSQPPWLLASPRPLRVCDGMPTYAGVLRLEALPERIEAGWWDGFDITRDYFIAHSQAGERLWVFRDRRGGGWYLHGLFQ
jgi:protein ImuB